MLTLDVARTHDLIQLREPDHADGGHLAIGGLGLRPDGLELGG